MSPSWLPAPPAQLRWCSIILLFSFAQEPWKKRENLVVAGYLPVVPVGWIPWSLHSKWRADPHDELHHRFLSGTYPSTH